MRRYGYYQILQNKPMFTHKTLNFPEHFLLDAPRIDEVFELVDSTVVKEQYGCINIAFLHDGEIQELNRIYRWIDSPTDVLSFHYVDDYTFTEVDSIVWEIVLSEAKIIHQAEEHHHSPREECEILIIHGLLHLLGYDHESDSDFETMWEHESKIRETLWLNLER